MSLRALLIKPPKVGTSTASVSVNFEPLGLLCVAAFVREFSDHRVEVLDAQAENACVERLEDGGLRMAMPDDLLRRRIAKADPQVVGISALFEAQEDEVLRIARLVKSVCGAVIVVGGLDAGVRYQRYLATGVIDLVVRGDGEETFLEVLERLDRGEGLTGIAGTCEPRESGGAHRNAARVPRLHLDAHPFPARDLLPRALYDTPRAQRASFRFSRETPAFLLQASRGCRLRCAFCDIVAVHDRWSAHSPEYVVSEIQHCVEHYGAREIVFADDNFMLDQRWAARILKLIAERRLGISIDIMAGVAVWTLGEAMIDLMVRAGVYRVCLPIESGNPETIRFIKKPVDLERARRMIDYCNRRGLYTFANLIIGFPFETEDDVRRTIAWGRESGLDAVHYFIATPLPGARMYPIYEDRGWIDRRAPRSVTWRTEHFTREELERLAVGASLDYVRRRAAFYAKPRNARSYLVPKLAGVRRLRYAGRLAMRILGGAIATRGGRSWIPSATSRDDQPVGVSSTAEARRPVRRADPSAARALDPPAGSA